MRRIQLALLICLVALPAAAKTYRLTPENFHFRVGNLIQPDGSLPDSTVLVLTPGDYELIPSHYTDPSCGNCEDSTQTAEATLGWKISGRNIAILGEHGKSKARFITNAGYGLLFEDCEDCALGNVEVTGGRRDIDPDATSAAVLARRSRLSVFHCDITENLGDSTLVDSIIVGVVGIAGREGAELDIHHNRILRNSWDGIALYRGATALIEDNLIDGVDGAGRAVGGGRGVGIGVTWDAKATVRRNRIANYWKGIGFFVDARGEARENVIESMRTWGISVWSAGKGKPAATLADNLIADCGACGVSLSFEESAAPGFCAHNMIVRTGQNEKYDAADYYCHQCPLAVHAIPPGYALEGNMLWENRRADGAPGQADLEAAAFFEVALPYLNRLASRPSLEDSPALGELRESAEAQ